MCNQVSILNINIFHVSVNHVQSKLQFKDICNVQVFSKLLDKFLQLTDNVEKVLFTLHCSSCNSESV